MPMSSWKLDARSRFEQAALNLYAERGYERTTVADIAREAGLTERTYFRYFVDKREVLFGEADSLRTLLASTVAEAPEPSAPMDAVAMALEAGAAPFGEDREHARERYRVISATPALQERELMKFSELAIAVAAALRGRGVAEPAATLIAETGILAFKVAFERWVRGDEEPDLARMIRRTLDELRHATAAI